jgi:hypothetical protein
MIYVCICSNVLLTCTNLLIYYLFVYLIVLTLPKVSVSLGRYSFVS